MVVTTQCAAESSDAIDFDAIDFDATAAAGMADIHDVFDRAMARLAAISLSWEQRSSDAPESAELPSGTLAADSGPAARAA